MKNVLRHLSSLLAPIVVCGVVPCLILLLEHHLVPHAWLAPSIVLQVSGVAIGVCGLALLIVTIRQFIRDGGGTIMPWDPTQRLIVKGPYLHVRNPMILGTILLQIGEAGFFLSPGILVLALLNFIINTVYFIYSEEPGLIKRFGDTYRLYQSNVPRWVPRLKPWRPNR
jgi:protein-S-isoprenylcysteine O-methyltransferase Ste14